MATLTIWNIEDEVVLEDRSKTIEAIEYVLEAFRDENDVFGVGGERYEIKHDVSDNLMKLADELEDTDGFIVGRFEMRA